MKVSVVVPVYNPGRYLDRCVASMLGQSLSSAEYEVIFVDDGSTDETPARLDELARGDPRFRVVHIPNSGWPGRPRNVGISEARGEYVQFLDQDDAMAPEALERLYEMGSRNRADIVIGKMAGDFRSHAPAASHAIRGVPHVLFRRNRDACTIEDAPLIDSLTPHKMFRTAFLREHGITFPEGKRRLEDQLFMIRAYFAATTVSILADRVCYFYMERADGGNAGSVRIDPASYYADLRWVLEVVIANTEPGDFRNRLLRRFLRVEMLGRLSEPFFPLEEPEFRAELFVAVRQLAMDLIDTTVDDGLGAVLRMRAMLLRADRPDHLLTLAQRCAEIRAASAVEAVAWKAGRLAITCSAWFEIGADDHPLALRRQGERYLLDPVLTEGLLSEPIDVTAELKSLHVTLMVRDRTTGARWSAPTKSRLDLVEEGAAGSDHPLRPILRATANLSPLEVAGGRPLERGNWDLSVRLTGLGLDREVGVGARRSPDVDAACLPALLGDGPQIVMPQFDEQGDLTLDIGRRDLTIAAAVLGRSVRFVRDGRKLCVRLAAAGSDRTERVAVSLVLRGPELEARLPGRLEVREGTVVLTADAGRQLAGVRRGPYTLAARLDGQAGPEVPLGTVRVRVLGRITATGEYRIRPLESAKWVVAGWSWRVHRRMEGWGWRVYRRMPAGLQRAARAGYRAIR
jgi:glycosyltransferase involved in cell wall biosynthesis